MTSEADREVGEKMPRLMGTSEIAVTVFGATPETLRAKIQMIYRLVRRNGIPVFKQGKKYFFDPRDFSPKHLHGIARNKMRMSSKLKP